MNRLIQIERFIAKRGHFYDGSLGFCEIGSGCSRTVFRYRKSRTVFKIGDSLCNRTEWNLYQQAPKALRSLLAKPIRISECGSILEMEYIPLILVDVDAYHLNIPFLFHSQIREYGFSHLVGFDVHDGNIGLKSNGHVKMVDYGYLARGQTFTRAEIRKKLKRKKRCRVNKVLAISQYAYRKLHQQRF
jgi:hypothetical protein